MTVPLKIERIYAWIATEKDGSEGVPSMSTPDGWHHAMLGADKERVESYREQVVMLRKQLGIPIRLVCFERLVELERLP